ncbi:hypothetical protein [Bacillus cereus]|uniref:hypothetical protein n=1 Tax=Bacillus cereus TaxID=1396 RepID=UPI00027AA089|nr:hypothetical protein [Bacillus cereus]EJS63047.1 hypothetical protein ICU_04796 [Bacillus cereus BAG2X1-1]EJS69179.1 hypothetical protein ICY_04603 [Bacillus cereus BAG2X1-3]
MSKKDFKLQKKEDFIVYLRFLLIDSYRELESIQKYMTQVNEIIVRKKLKERPQRVITSDIYESARDKLGFVSNRLLNIYGDHANSAMSYKKFREKANKVKDLNLPELDVEIKTYLNDLNSARNWSNHIPESLLTSQLKVNPSLYQPPYNSFTIAMYQRYRGDWLLNLYEQYETNIYIYKQIHACMITDCTVLIGEPPQLNPIDPGIRALNDMQIAVNSWNIQTNKK